MSKEMSTVTNKEPLMHISKRDGIETWKSWLIRIIAVLLSLVVCAGVIVALTGLNPIEVYKGIFDGAIGTKRRAWMTIRDTLVLLCIAVGITPAFKMRFWNIGAEGQVLIGGLVAALIMVYFGSSLPAPLLFAAMVVVGTYQIVTRYFFGRPSTVSEELLTYSFTWMALLSSALVFGKRDHMRMGFLADKITGTPRKVLEIISECLVLLLAAVVMLYGGVSIMKLTMTQVTASLGIPMGTVYTVLPLSGALIVVYSVLNIIDLATDSVEEHSSTSAE